MIRHHLALTLAAACLALTPIAAAAQTISAPGFAPPVSASCGTVTVSTPCLDLSQAWSGTGTLTLLKANVSADPGPANSASLLLDLQIGGVSALAVDKGGSLAGVSNRLFVGNFKGLVTGGFSGSGYYMPQLAGIGWYNANSGGGTIDLALLRDAANVLAQRNGTSAQQFAIYNTYTDASNYEVGQLRWSGNSFIINTGMSGTGTARVLKFGTGGTNRWNVDASGNFVAETDNSYDIGQSGATRPRNVYVAGNVTVGSDILVAGGTKLTWSAATKVSGTNDGVLLIEKQAGSGAQNTVAQLPSCASALKGARSFVTDASATTFLSTVAGSGANNVPVVCDGTNWKIGALDLRFQLYGYGLNPANDNLPDWANRALG